jgi:hypothetical protein
MSRSSVIANIRRLAAFGIVIVALSACVSSGPVAGVFWPA